MDKEAEAFREFAKLSSSYSRQMTEAWKKRVENGQFNKDSGIDFPAEYREALKNYLSLKTPF